MTRLISGVATLTVLTSCFCGLVHGQTSPEDPAEVLRNFGDAYRAEQIVEAIGLGLEYERLSPGNPRHQYNMACVYALAGNETTASAWLRRSIENGFRWPSTLRIDPDLDLLRPTDAWPRYQAVVRKNSEAFRTAVRTAYDANPPIFLEPESRSDEEPAPLIIALHGYGDRPDHYPRLWGPAAARFDAVLVAPRGPEVYGTGYSWDNVDDAEAIVLAAVDWASDRFSIDPGRIILTGFSQGGFVTLAVGMRHPDRFAGLIPMAGPYDPERDRPSAAGPDAPRLCFMVGSEDRAESAVRRAAKDCEAAGYAVRLRIFHGIGHTFPRMTKRELGKALRFVLEDRSSRGTATMGAERPVS